MFITDFFILPNGKVVSTLPHIVQLLLSTAITQLSELAQHFHGGSQLRQIQPVRSKMAGRSLWISQNWGKIQPVQSKMASKPLWISQNSHSRRWRCHSWPVFACSRVASAAARMISEENSGGCGASETRSAIKARQTEIIWLRAQSLWWIF